MEDTAYSPREREGPTGPTTAGDRASARRGAMGAFRRHSMLWGGGALLFNLVLGLVAMGSLGGGLVFGLLGLALGVGLAAVEARIVYRQGLRPSPEREGLGGGAAPDVDGQVGSARGRIRP